VSDPRPLTVLQVASGLPNFGGTELHLINLAEQLVGRGHAVHVLARPGSYVFEESTRRGLTVHPGVVKSQSDYAAYPRLLPLFRSVKYDVVHVHMFPDHLMPPAAARRAGVPVNVMSHHLPYPLKKGIHKRIAVKHFLFNRMVAVSESVRQTLIGSGLRPEQVLTIHHGTDTDAFRQTTLPPGEVRREWGVPEGRFLVGVVGRVAEEKGVDQFLKAMALLADAPVHGVVVGEGKVLAEMRDLATRLRLDDRVTFAGFRADVNNAVNAMDALLLASTWAEPCAAVIQQAMAVSKPVIGTNIGGTPEMIADGETGILVPPSDAGAIAAAVRRLLGDPALSARMGDAGRVRADAHFTLSGMTDRIEALYREELARCAAR
jgi:glycosyltransferase involved in cell wall biosynthesis